MITPIGGWTAQKSAARWLARLLRLGTSPEGYIYPKAQRPVHDLLRKRQYLVKQQTANVLSLRHIILRNTRGRLSGERIKRLSLAAVTTLLPNEEQALAVSSGLAVITCLAEQTKLVEKRVHTQIRSTSLYRLLQTIHSIGPILAQTILLETGDIGRFPRVRDDASSCAASQPEGGPCGESHVKCDHDDWTQQGTEGFLEHGEC
jgi:transposase